MLPVAFIRRVGHTEVIMAQLPGPYSSAVRRVYYEFCWKDHESGLSPTSRSNWLRPFKVIDRLFDLLRIRGRLAIILVDECGVEVDHNDSVILSYGAQHVVRHVPRMVT